MAALAIIPVEISFICWLAQGLGMFAEALHRKILPLHELIIMLDHDLRSPEDKADHRDITMRMTIRAAHNTFWEHGPGGAARTAVTCQHCSCDSAAHCMGAQPGKARGLCVSSRRHVCRSMLLID